MFLVKHKSVQMTILLPITFYAKGDNYVFSCYLMKKMDEVEHQYCIYYYGELLGVLSSNFLIF